MSISWSKAFLKNGKKSQAQEDLKKFKIETILKFPEHIALEYVDVWFQDEARFGQQNTITHLWTEKATRPRAVKQ
ncbi:hypothetical protein CGH91_01730 [Vibrio parahaemolyticus]|nr:hypothetical protein CGJ16_23925 [Vibrio parahaemolyticus]TOL87549.1 hypothetical protein CGH91_01730 [Vibrio parahaemolyticus]